MLIKKNIEITFNNHDHLALVTMCKAFNIFKKDLIQSTSIVILPFGMDADEFHAAERLVDKILEGE